MNATTQHNAAEAADAVRVTIVMKLHAAYLETSVAHVVMPMLEHRVNRFRHGGPSGVRRSVRTVKHYVLDDKRGLVFSAGLVSRVKQQLEQHGYTVDVRDETHWGHLCDLDVDFLQSIEAGHEDAGVLKALAVQPRGQIIVSSLDSLAHMIVLFGRLFSQFNIYVVARNLQSVHQLVERIASQSDRPVTSDPRKSWGSHRRLFVGTTQAFNDGWSDAYQIILGTDIQSMLAKRTEDIIAHRQNATWYGLRQSHQQLDSYENFRAEEIFGEVIYAERGPGPQPAEVDVLLVNAPSKPKATFHDALERKRVTVWQNNDRNKIIADLTLGVQRQHRRWLIRDGLLSLEQVQAVFTTGGHLRVAILVESTEHAKQLHAFLPHWEVRTLNTPTSCVPAVGDREIATMAYAERYGIYSDVLIRADGSAVWPLSDGAFPRKSLLQDRVVLVDVDSDGDRRAKRDTQGRITAYQERDWEIISSAAVSTTT